MPSQPSDSNASNHLSHPIQPPFLALVRVYDRVMRYRATPFSVPPEGEDPLIPVSDIPQTVHHPDPESHVAYLDEICAGLDLEDAEVKATREMVLKVQAAQERMTNGLAIQPEFEPCNTLPLHVRGSRMVRQVKEVTVLQPIMSESISRQKDTFLNRPSPEITTKSVVRNLRWKSDQLLAGKIVWPAEPLLMPVTGDLKNFLQYLGAPWFPLTPWRAALEGRQQDGGWMIQKIPGPLIPHHGAMTELVGLFPSDHFVFQNERLNFDPEIKETWEKTNLNGSQDQIMDLLSQALEPPGGVPQILWMPGWVF